MPNRKGRKGKGSKGDGCVIPFHGTVSGNLTAGVFTLGFNAGSFTGRLATEADPWALFRLNKLRFRLLPTALATAAVYVGSEQDTPPSTIVQATEVITSVLISASQTSPTQWMNVPKKILSGILPWYRTYTGAEPANESTPGAIIVCGGGTSAFVLEFAGVVEFKQGLDPANTPEIAVLYDQIRQLRKKAHVEKQRSALLTALAPPREQGKKTPDIRSSP